ncbi:amidohydrolase [Streptomyces sp. NPDC020965]|uniref:amidohydrolase n=1 Tax=Streptomyces sp. NPDC020965 TaxID=3365105 RepID=UPI0037BDE985
MTSAFSRRSLLLSAGGAGATALAPTRATAAPSRRSAAFVIHNARVLTGVRGQRPREAIAVGRDGTVLATGAYDLVRRCAGRDTDMVDASGATVMSGIVDGHAHPLGAGSESLLPSLEHAQLTVDQLQERLTGFLAAEPQEPDGWLAVGAWNPVGLLPTGTQPHRRFLDALPTRRPIALFAADGHSTWVNGRALDLAGITAATPDPPGGEIVRDGDGSPTGWLTEDAQALVESLIPAQPDGPLHDACARMLAHAASLGVTTFLDARATESQLDIYEALAVSGRLPQRIAPALWLDPEEIRDPAAALSWLRRTRRRYREVPGLRFGPVKVFLDGVIEHPKLDAALLEPYLDGAGRPTDHIGELRATPADYRRLAVVLDRTGWQLHTHAIGDRAVRTALDGAEAALRANGRRDNRHTVTHCQLVHPDDYRRFARLGVVASMQLQWAARDTFTMEALLPYIGLERHRRLYPSRSLERAGAVIAGGSDWPVDPLEPWNQLRTAIDREGAHAGQGALYPELEGLSRAAALRAHTANAAYQLGLDRITGRLTPGRAADLILLDRDVTRVPVREISDTQVRLTFVGGRCVYDAESAAGKTARTSVNAVARAAACGCSARRR